jgi:hypothetical protein
MVNIEDMNMKENVVKEKSFKFAVRIVNLYKHLSEEKNAYNYPQNRQIIINH